MNSGTLQSCSCLHCWQLDTTSQYRPRCLDISFGSILATRKECIGLDSLLSSVRRRHLVIFGHVRQLPEATPAHVALKLALDVRSDRTLDDDDNGTQWRRLSRRPPYTWVQQLEADTGLTADDLWNIASDHDAWRALRPIAGQADQWVSEWPPGPESRLSVAVRSGYWPDIHWSTAPGHPHHSETQQVDDETPLAIRQEWKTALDCGHRGSLLWTSAASVLWW